jgi:hypothetical protein
MPALTIALRQATVNPASGGLTVGFFPHRTAHGQKSTERDYLLAPIYTQPPHIESPADGWITLRSGPLQV